jgi:hypothetical protein
MEATFYGGGLRLERVRLSVRIGTPRSKSVATRLFPT